MRIFRLHRAQRGAGLRRVAALSGEMESGGDADVVRGVDAFAGMPGDASSFAAESDTDRFGLQLGGIEAELKETKASFPKGQPSTPRWLAWLIDGSAGHRAGAIQEEGHASRHLG
jgi:hypothetical protein